MRNIFIILSLFISSTFVFGNNTAPQSIFDKMNYTEVLEVTLEADYTEVLADRKSNEKFSGKLKFNDVAGNLQLWNVELALRGRFRRMKCAEMPPLKINFSKDDLSSKGLSASNDLKLVTQCVQDERQAKELVVREYLTYKMYNLFSEASYRVQLLKINYKDNHTGMDMEHWGFLIEDTAQMRARLGAKKMKKSEDFEISDLNQEQTRTATVFQYMIGNYDYDVPARRNLKLIKIGGEIIPVPYDFDFAGLVNAPYATANTALGVFSRYDRVYLGVESDSEKLKETFNTFKAKQRKLISVIKSCDEINSLAKKDMIKYIESFFQKGPNFVMRNDALATSSFQAK